MVTITCQFCGKTAVTERRTRKYCSDRCMQKARNGSDLERACRFCGTVFEIITRSDANRQYCSQRCSKKANAKNIKTWFFEHPEAMKGYNKKRAAKNPGASKEKARSNRLAIISLLGGKCIVCGVSNPPWLHVDYIPTTRDKPYRHPRSLNYTRNHLEDFRLLCANHHYELTLTGHIEGTEIYQ